MPRVSCPKCKYSFTPRDPNRKTVECPDCGARFPVGGEAEPPVAKARGRDRDRGREDSAPAQTGGFPVLLVVGGLLAVLVGLGTVGGAVWYFALRKPAAPALVQANDPPPPPAEVKPAPKPKPKTLKLAAAPELADPDIYTRLLPSTVYVRYLVTKTEVVDGRRVPVTYESSGSGVLVCRDPNLVLTNAHVVRDQPLVEVYFPAVRPNGQPEVDKDFYVAQRGRLGLAGRVLRKDERIDTALVLLERVPETAQPIPLAAESARRLEKVFTIGNSGVKRGALWRGNSGDVRNIEEKNPWTGESARFLTTQQPINHGDSGGPVVNRRVELVAITQSGEFKRLESGPGRGPQVTGDDNVSYNVDVFDLRDFLTRSYRLEFGGEFPAAHPVADAGPEAAPDGEGLDVPDYVLILREGDTPQARAAVGRLAHAGAPAVGPLTTVLEDPQAAPRWALALDALGQIGQPAADALPLAAKRLTAEDPGVRMAAAKFLAAQGPAARKYIPALVTAGGVNDPQIRAACEAAVAKLAP